MSLEMGYFGDDAVPAALLPGAVSSPTNSSSSTEVRSPTSTSSDVRSPTSTSTEVRSPTSTSTEVRSPTSTSTEAHTTGNTTSTSTDGSYNTTNNYAGMSPKTMGWLAVGALATWLLTRRSNYSSRSYSFRPEERGRYRSGRVDF